MAPTGSGKTLSAFLWAIDTLTATPRPEGVGTRVLYVSPLKALGVDVERNLRAPLGGIQHTATRLGLPAEPVSVGVRSGDTPAAERRALIKNPPDILITTPESLYLMLTSQARESLRGVETIIIDEIHAVASTKRGAHLALTLERLDELVDSPVQRIGLSATVRPREEVARFLGGVAPVMIVAPASQKTFDLRVLVPVPDMTDIAPRASAEGATEGALTGEDAADRPGSIWPAIEEAILGHVLAHRSTIVFANSRRLAERLTAHLNEQYALLLEAEGGLGERVLPRLPPAELIGGSGQTGGLPADAPLLARAHHGSVSKEQRGEIEDALKSGALRCVVATSSLELGIDMGEVDLVIQVESPPSVASGLQRVGRAGHQVGEVSRGFLYPKHRADLLGSAVVAERMVAGSIEAIRVPSNPLDILAQQTIAACALEPINVEEWFAAVRRSAPFNGLPRSAFEATLDLVAGRYPSDEFAELRPRVLWDREAGTLEGRPGAQRLAVTSGGTIPDRGLFAVYLIGSDASGTGSRVGELDEEMVYESRVGDVFALGTTSWKIQEITHDRVIVVPAFGQPGRLPFWRGDGIGRPAELGEAVGAFIRETGGGTREAALARAAAAGLDDYAADNLWSYLDEQRAATGVLPTDRSLVVERSRDELGDWRVILHSPYGMQVHAPWALAVGARLRERLGLDGSIVASDDGIIVRLPDAEAEPPGAELFLFDAEELEEIVTEEVGGSALFASRFRECAARALLLPNYSPGKRAPLWQQRQRSAQLLDVAKKYPTFPILLEAVRECLQDVYDVPALLALMRRLAARSVRIAETATESPSPFAKSLLFGYVGSFMYEGDSPLAERKAAALALDPGLLAELLGRVELRELLDPEVLKRTEAELQRLAPDRRLRGIEGTADLLRLLGPLSVAEVARRLRGNGEDPESAPAEPAAAAEYLEALRVARRALAVPIAGVERWIAVEDAARVRDALGTPLPLGLPQAFTEPVADPLGDLIARFARTHGPFRVGALADRLGLGVAVVAHALGRLADERRLVRGEFLPSTGVAGEAARDQEWCDTEILRRIRVRSLAALRQEVEPVDPATFGRFLPSWQGIGGGLRGVDGVATVIDQLAGVYLPASAWESLILPQRVADYSPALLDQLTAAGEVLWSGRGALPGRDGWIALHPADLAPLSLALPAEEPREFSPAQEAVLGQLAGGGAYFFRQLAQARPDIGEAELGEALWELVWAGLIGNDTLAPLRALTGGGGAHRQAPVTPRARMHRGRLGRAGSLGALPKNGPGGYAVPGSVGGPSLPAAVSGAGLRGLPEEPDRGEPGALPRRPTLPRRGLPPRSSEAPITAGRWSLLPKPVGDVTVRAAAASELLLERYGVLTRGSVMTEGTPGGFALAYRVLSGMEDGGSVRRGYFIEGLGGAQFARSATIDRLRQAALPDDPDPTRAPVVVTLAATDPANPYGAALAWPEVAGNLEKKHRPGRKAGGLVTLVDGRLVLFMERGGKSLLGFSAEESTLAAAIDSLAAVVRAGRVDRLAIERFNGEFVLASAVSAALRAAGFTETPRGLRLRRA